MYISFKDTQRTFHNLDGSIRKADNGYFMLTMDRHMNDYVEGIFVSFSLLTLINQGMLQTLFLDLSLLYPLQKNVRLNYFVVCLCTQQG